MNQDTKTARFDELLHVNFTALEASRATQRSGRHNTADQLLSPIPTTNYRQLPRYANSDLGEFRDSLFCQYPKRPATKALTFGTLFHALVLERLDPAHLPAKLLKQLTGMYGAIQRDKFASRTLAHLEVEREQLWEDADTGLPCKAKLDGTYDEQGLIIDLKTTSARTYGEFLQSCEKYDYDRQAAFYLDGSQVADRFVFLGVQKQAPYAVYYFEASACPGCIEGGRKKYRTLLRDIAKTGFIPSSWAKPPTTNIVGVYDEYRSGSLE